MEEEALTENAAFEKKLAERNKELAEGFTRVSESPLWPLMDRLFTERSADIWHKNFIPNEATSNSFIAHAHANLIKAFVDEHGTNLTNDDPAYILDVGAGSGRYSFHLLRHLFGSDPAHPRTSGIKLVMTEMATEQLNYYKAHPQLKPYADAGLLDFANYNAIKDDGLSLLVSGVRLNPKSISQPIVMIASYLFDSVAMDFFAMQGDILAEKLVNMEFDEKPIELERQLKNIKLSYITRQCTTHYYDDPAWNQILADYDEMGGQFQFSVPIGAFKMMDNMRAMTSAASMVIVNDYGYLSPITVRRTDSVVVNDNGNKTVALNFDALARFVKFHGGETLTFDGAFTEVATVAYVFGAGAIPQTKFAYTDAIMRFGSDDYMHVKKQFETMTETITIRDAVSLIRLSCYDSRMFLMVRDKIMEATRMATKARNHLMRETLLDIADRTLNMAYKFEENYEPSLEISQMYMMLGQPKKARKALEAARHIHQHNQGYSVLLDRLNTIEGRI